MAQRGGGGGGVDRKEREINSSMTKCRSQNIYKLLIEKSHLALVQYSANLCLKGREGPNLIPGDEIRRVQPFFSNAEKNKQRQLDKINHGSLQAGITPSLLPFPSKK